MSGKYNCPMPKKQPAPKAIKPKNNTKQMGKKK